LAELGSEYRRVANFFSGDSTARDGVRVVAGAFDGDSRDDLVTGAQI
jgi:hypothetical protein